MCVGKLILNCGCGACSWQPPGASSFSLIPVRYLEHDSTCSASCGANGCCVVSVFALFFFNLRLLSVACTEQRRVQLRGPVLGRSVRFILLVHTIFLVTWLTSLLFLRSKFPNSRGESNGKQHQPSLGILRSTVLWKRQHLGQLLHCRSKLHYIHTLTCHVFRAPFLCVGWV
jgi:hypothetical protein